MNGKKKQQEWRSQKEMGILRKKKTNEWKKERKKKEINK